MSFKTGPKSGASHSAGWCPASVPRHTAFRHGFDLLIASSVRPQPARETLSHSFTYTVRDARFALDPDRERLDGGA